VLSLLLTLTACDKVTKMEVVLGADRPVTVECIAEARRYSMPIDRFDRLPRQPSVNGDQFVVQRELSSVSVTLDGSAPESVSIGAIWLGSAPSRDELGTLHLIEAVQAAVMQACSLNAAATKISRQCVGAGVCEQWLAGNR
jgi:hypothetical protein